MISEIVLDGTDIVIILLVLLLIVLILRMAR